jgi:hypothetical protein
MITMTIGQRNPSISVKSLLSIINPNRWEPLDTALTAKVTGARKNGATATFRRMLGIHDLAYGPRYHTIIGEVLINNIEGVRVARCYDVFVQRVKPTRGGHRFFWRTFPMSATDAEILDSASKEVSARAFLSTRTGGTAPAATVPRAMSESELGEAANLLFGQCKTEATTPQAAKPTPSPSAPVAPPVDQPQPIKLAVDVKAMSDDDLIAAIKSRRKVLTALEYERDLRVRSATNLIAKLKA